MKYYTSVTMEEHTGHTSWSQSKKTGKCFVNINTNQLNEFLLLQPMQEFSFELNFPIILNV